MSTDEATPRLEPYNSRRPFEPNALTCAQVEEKLEVYARRDPALDATVSGQMHDHIMMCHACREKLQPVRERLGLIPPSEDLLSLSSDS